MCRFFRFKTLPSFSIIVFLFFVGQQQCGALSPEPDYGGQLRDKLYRNWDSTGNGENIHVLIHLLSDGCVAEITVKGERPQLIMEDQVKQLILRSQPFGPLPANYRQKPFVTLTFNWKHDGAKTSSSIAGPAFFAQPPDSVKCEMGLKKQPFDAVITEKLVKTVKVLPNGPGSMSTTTAYVKLKPNGTIAKISIVSKPKNALGEKLLYDGLGAAQPFGALPKELIKSPYYEIKVLWIPLSSKSSTCAPGIHCQHFDSVPKWLQ